VWDLPDKKKLSEGYKEIREAQKLRPQTAKEQGFIAAAADVLSEEFEDPLYRSLQSVLGCAREDAYRNAGRRKAR
jgi:hypothetical protein